METNQKVKLALTIACFAAVSIFATTHYRRRRRQKSSFQNLCYLETESKPQSAFKRVLADNSYTPFKHLIRNQEEPSHLHPYKEEITALLENSQLESFSFVDGEVDLEMKGSHVWVDTEDQLVKLVEILSKETVFGVDTEQHSLRSFLGFTALIQISTQKEDYLVDTIALHDVMTLLHPVFSDPSICKVFHGADNDVLWLQRDFHIYVVNLFDTAKACEVLSKPHKSLAYLLETYCGVATNKMLQVFIHGVGDDDACSPSVHLGALNEPFHGGLADTWNGRISWRGRSSSASFTNRDESLGAFCELLGYLEAMQCENLKESVQRMRVAMKREDWRLRPLSEEMVHYARGDAHYLLYIANCLINELKKLDNDCLDDKLHFLLEASRRSNMICLQLYTKEVEVSPGDSAASSIISRFLNGQGGLPLTCETKELVGRLCMWRDLMARVHDESLRYVLSDQAIAALSSKVPTTTKETYDTISEADLNLDSLSVFLPTPSAVVYSHLEDVHHLLRDKISNQNDAFVKLLQKHLGRNGSCPVSIYNYSLLSKSTLKLINGSTVKKNGSKAAGRIGKKASRELFVQKFSCKAPVYHNCRIYASDGRLLCYCDRRKLEWYLRRNLAKLVDSDPLAVMLLFEPKGRPEDEDNDFYIQSKKNMCVGCGERNHYLRYRIIPSCYRVHFPEHLKSHRSHDIVLLCVDCHEIAHSAAEKHKRQIAGEYGIPLFVRKVTDSSQTEIMPRTSASVESFEEAGVSPLQLRTAAMALMRHGPRMPTKRREELTEIVMKFFGGREVSQEDLERALLVGMSPHERRRLEKKRGLSFKHSSGSLLLSKDSENNADSMSISGLSETLDDDVMNDLQTVEEANCCKQESQNACQEMHNGGSNGSVCSESEINDKSSATGTEDLKLDKERISGGEIVVDTNEDHERRRLPDEICDSYSCGVNGTGPHKHNQKLSLLGHGPHGKQVVDHLLKEYGEDGVNQFCQRWRQVFVEAIHPRFLPSGWDVMHSGRRNFGKYSVFNPTKKDTPTASD